MRTIFDRLPLAQWRKARNIFKRPVPRIYFGFWGSPKIALWIGDIILKTPEDKKDTTKYKVLSKLLHFFTREDPCLPVWRNGPCITPFRKHTVWNKERNGFMDPSHVFTDEFKKKLEKWHLGWLKTEYYLPRFLSFHLFVRDVMWKWKFDDICYEFPPQFTIVLFNIAFSVHWHAPGEDNKNCLYDYRYWESLLYYLHGEKVFTGDGDFADVMDLDKECGFGVTSLGKGSEERYFWCLDPSFLKNKKYAEKLEYLHKKQEKSLLAKKEFLTCPKCGKKMKLVEGVVLTTYPVQYEYRCKCGHVKYSLEKIEDQWYL